MQTTISEDRRGATTTARHADEVEKETRLQASRLSGIVSRFLPHLALFGGMVLLTIVATWPMLPQLGGYVIDKGDPLYSVWAMAWQAHAISTNPLGLFDANVMYPFPATLTFDELSFAEALLAAPVLYLTGNPVLSHNLLLFLTFALSGYGVWLLVRELTGSSSAGWVAGAAFAFSFYRLNHLPHQTLINTQWMPFVLLAAFKLLWTGQWRWAMALGGLFALQALSGHYLAFYTAMLLGLFVLFYPLVQRGRLAMMVVGKMAVALAASLVLILPVMVPYVLGQGNYDFRRNLFEAERFSNTLTSFLAIFRGSPVLRDLLSPFKDPEFWAIERSAFPGFTVVLLSGLALWMALRYRHSGRDIGVELASEGVAKNLPKHTLFFATVALLSAFLSLGPSLQLTYAANASDPQAIQRIISLPYAFLHEWVPGFQSMRVVARIGVLTALALSVLAGFGTLALLTFFRRRLPFRFARLAVPALALVIGLVPVAESWSAPVAMQAVGTRDAVPPVYRWLASQPKTVILEYPMVYYKRGDPNVEMANLYQYYSAYHWHQSVNGSTSIRPYAYSALVIETEDCFPCPRSLDAIWALGVEYVVVHLDNLSEPQRADFLWRATNPVAKVVSSFTLVEDFGADRVYKLQSREVGDLKSLIPPGASLLLADPEKDPLKGTAGRIGGGYSAALGYMLRDRTLFGDRRLSFGQSIRAPVPSRLADYALLWAGQDPQDAGYAPGDKVWANEFVALYRRPAAAWKGP